VVRRSEGDRTEKFEKIVEVKDEKETLNEFDGSIICVGFNSKGGGY
jgi:hypothetical protein